jgi:hypothetical protein
MKWCVGLVTIAMLGCQPADDGSYSNPYCGSGSHDPECDPAGVGYSPVTATVHWQFVTLAGDASDCLLAERPDLQLGHHGPSARLLGTM